MTTSEIIKHHLQEVNQDAFYQIFADFRDYVNIRAMLFYTMNVLFLEEKMDTDYEPYKKVSKPTAKGTIVFSGILKRAKDKERKEIEEGLMEWENEEEEEIK